MKKFLKMFLIVIINIVLIGILVELLCYESEAYKRNPYFWYKESFDKTYETIKNERMRKPVGLNYKSRPILIMGCSFAWGSAILPDENLQYKLSQAMKRPVYNRGYEWYWGPHTMLYQARREDFYDEVPNPEYVIYILINDHANRVGSGVMETFFDAPYLRYYLKKGRLVRENVGFISNLFAYKKYRQIKFNMTPREKSFEKMNEFFIETKEEFDKHWKNYKFVILYYDYSQDALEDRLNNDKCIEKLRDKGFHIIYTNDLTGEPMNNDVRNIAGDNCHPSEKAWEKLTPLIVKELKKIK